MSIIISQAPQKYQRVLRMADAHDGDSGYDDKISEVSEAEKAANTFCSEKKGDECGRFLDYLEKSEYSLPQIRAELKATQKMTQSSLDQALIDALKKVGIEIKTVEVILNEGANVNAKDNEGNTPLHMAIFHGHTDIAKLLLDNGANVNARGCFGATPLHLASKDASWGKTMDLVKLLLDKGANPKEKDIDGKTPFDTARDSEIKAFLEPSWLDRLWDSLFK